MDQSDRTNLSALESELDAETRELRANPFDPLWWVRRDERINRIGWWLVIAFAMTVAAFVAWSIIYG